MKIIEHNKYIRENIYRTEVLYKLDRYVRFEYVREDGSVYFSWGYIKDVDPVLYEIHNTTKESLECLYQHFIVIEQRRNKIERILKDEEE
jgi:uncharacterized protein YeeX (DUF496 family)